MPEITLLLCSLLAAAPSVQKLTLVTSEGPIGTLTITTTGNRIDNTWRVDDNGRGPKIEEQVELGPDLLPRRWLITGRAGVGAPVKETLVVDGGVARWKSLDDEGEAKAGSSLYVANDATPWAEGFYLEHLLRSKGQVREVLPGGQLRAEKLGEVSLSPGANAERATAYALWGLDFAPTIVLRANGRFVGRISPGTVLVEERHVGHFRHLSKLAAELSAQLLERLSKRLTHPLTEPLWLTEVRVFDPASGRRSEPTNVVVYGEQIVGLRADPPPAGALAVNGAGATLMPGLFDAHAHATPWNGPLHLASGVTFSRDPGNDNESLLELERRLAAGAVMGPRIVKSGFLEGASPYSAHGGFVIRTLEEALDKVRWYADRGFWGLKIYNSMNPDFVAPIATEAHRLGLHVSGHVPAFMTSERALRDGYDEIHHINQLVLSLVITDREDTRTPFRFTALGERLAALDLTSAPVRRLVQVVKERRAVLDPTMAIFSKLLRGRPGTVSPSDRGWLSHAPMPIQRSRKTAVLEIKSELDDTYSASWKKLEDVLVLLHREGVALVPGTDDVAGLMLHSELEAWVAAGIPAAAALTQATLAGAKLLGVEARLGSVAPGKLADLYLVEGDPTQDISALRKGRLVVKGGAYYFPDEIHAALGLKPFAARAEVARVPAPAPSKP